MQNSTCDAIAIDISWSSYYQKAEFVLAWIPAPEDVVIAFVNGMNSFP